MPIPQSRLITLAANGEALLDRLDALRQWAQSVGFTDTIVSANAIANGSPDDIARRFAQDVIAQCQYIQQHLASITEIPIALRKNIMAEHIHFEQHRRKNEMLAIHSRVKRQAQSETRNSEYLMPSVFSDLPPEAEQEWRSRPSQRQQRPTVQAAPQATQTAQEPDIFADYNSPEARAKRFAAWDAEAKAARTAHVAKLKEESKPELEELRERQRNRRMIPPGEELTIEEAHALTEKLSGKPTAKPELKPNGNGTVDPSDNNNPANLVRHLPTAEELLENNPAPIGKDVL